jgi:hypothetical protein
MEEKQQRHLPLLENGKVDLFLIHHWYQQEQPEKKTTFADWRLQQGFTAQMETDKIQMSPPLTYYRGQDPQEITKARKLHDQWASSYLQHQLAFDDWHLLYPTTAMPTGCTHHTPDPAKQSLQTLHLHQRVPMHLLHMHHFGTTENTLPNTTPHRRQPGHT